MEFVARDAASGQPTTWRISGGRIAGQAPASGPCSRWAAPALIDIQVNGFQGFDFNDEKPSADLVIGGVRALRAAGVGLSCPTITTGGFGHLRRALRAVADACEQDAATAHAIAGIHLEGPYIAPQDGPRGAHPLPYVRPPDWDEFQHFQEAARGTIRIVTLAPELPEAIPFIERLADAGIIASLGHHMATTAEIDAAVRAGAHLCTHLGNGAHAQLPRHPNYIWDQLGDDRLQAGFIVDGHHLPPSVVRSMLRAKGVERSILVSDAIFFAGMAAGRAEFMGLSIEMTPERKVVLSGTPYLAGSALWLCEGVGKAVQFAGVSLDEAVRMASTNPAKLLGVEARFGGLDVGREANLVVFDWDDEKEMRPRALLAQGEVIWGSLAA